MLERLKIVLMLPLSRKVVVGLAAGGLAFANRKWNLGLDDSSIHMLIGVAAFIVLGISIEDAANAHAQGQVDAAVATVNAQTDLDNFNKAVAERASEVSGLAKALKDANKLAKETPK